MASTLNQAMSTLGAVTPATRAKAEATWLACHLALGRAPGVLWGKGSSSEHATGRAVDFMVTQHGAGLDSAMGRWITDYLLTKASDWDLAWVIWAQRLYYPDGSSYLMEDRGSTTENHYDHPHAYWRSDRLITGTKPAPSITDRLEDDDMALTDQDKQDIARMAAEKLLEHEVMQTNGKPARILDIMVATLPTTEDIVDKLLTHPVEMPDGKQARVIDILARLLPAIAEG